MFGERREREREGDVESVGGRKRVLSVTCFVFCPKGEDPESAVAFASSGTESEEEEDPLGHQSTPPRPTLRYVLTSRLFSFSLSLSLILKLFTA